MWGVPSIVCIPVICESTRIIYESMRHVGSSKIRKYTRHMWEYQDYNMGSTRTTWESFMTIGNSNIRMYTRIMWEYQNYNVWSTKISNVYVTLLDIKKAFDSVWIEGLLYTLFEIGFDRKLWKLIKELCNWAACSVKVGGMQNGSK